jgi:nucleoside phosphorylase
LEPEQLVPLDAYRERVTEASPLPPVPALKQVAPGFAPRPRQPRVDIGVITALPLELQASRLIAEDLYGAGFDRVNMYALGVVARHSVAFTHSGMGNNGAAISAAMMLAKFPSIRLLVLVGIAGGIPSHDPEKRVRLGDVLFSSQVIQYDHQRIEPGHHWQLRATPHLAHALSAKAVEVLQIDAQSGAQPREIHLSRILGSMKATRPDVATDVLYDRTHNPSTTRRTRRGWRITRGCTRVWSGRRTSCSGILWCGTNWRRTTKCRPLKWRAPG